VLKRQIQRHIGTSGKGDWSRLGSDAFDGATIQKTHPHVIHKPRPLDLSQKLQQVARGFGNQKGWRALLRREIAKTLHD